MSKVTTKIEYKGMSFAFVKETKKLKMFFNEKQDYAIIVKNEEVLFEIYGVYGRNENNKEEVLLYEGSKKLPIKKTRWQRLITKDAPTTCISDRGKSRAKADTKL